MSGSICSSNSSGLARVDTLESRISRRIDEGVKCDAVDVGHRGGG